MDEVLAVVDACLRDSESRPDPFFNEAELQHELGLWLRNRLREGMAVYFERPASSFFPSARGLVKKEIDLVVEDPDASWQIAIELKCPRNGRVPETMFDACRDLQFLEQLVDVGFRGGIFLMHVDSHVFYESRLQTGIYSYFRGCEVLTGTINKPTGLKDRAVSLWGAYRIEWRRCGSSSRYWLQSVMPAKNDPRGSRGRICEL